MQKERGMLNKFGPYLNFHRLVGIRHRSQFEFGDRPTCAKTAHRAETKLHSSTPGWKLKTLFPIRPIVNKELSRARNEH